MTDSRFGLQGLQGTDFTKAVATTASVLVSSAQNGGDTHAALRTNQVYKSAVSSLGSKKSSTVIQKVVNKGSSIIPGILRRNRVDDDIQPKDFYQLPAELLNDIPDIYYDENKNGTVDTKNSRFNTRAISFSLFQGFTAALPEVDEVLENLQSGSDQLNLLTYENILQDQNRIQGDKNLNENQEHLLPKGVTAEKIRLSQSKSQLNHFKDEINYKLDLFEIRKGIATNEIQEIDFKIERLYMMRKQIFQKITNYESDETYLENRLQDIHDRLDFIEDMQIADSDDDNSELHEDDSESAYDNSTIKDDSVIIHKGDLSETAGVDESGVETDNSSSLLSKSVYGKLKMHSKKQKQRTLSRKHKPTLQQFYKPGSLIHEFEAHDDVITCLGFDEPYGTLVTASCDNTVKVWDMARYRCIGLLEGHLSTVRALEMKKNLVVTGSMDATLKLWDVTKADVNVDYADEPPLLHTFDSHTDEVRALCFDEKTLVSGSADKTIRQWDLYTGKCLQTIDVIWASSLMNSQTMKPTHAETNNWSALNLNNPTPSSTLVDSPFIGALQFYDAALATGTSDGIVRLWDLRSGDVIRQLYGHTGAVTALQFDDKNLTTGSLDRSTRIWDLRTGGIVDSFAYESPISSLQFDNSRIVSTNCEKRVKIYDRIEGRHWSCGGDLDTAEGSAGDEKPYVVNYARYHEGYMVESRSNGMLGVWAI